MAPSVGFHQVELLPSSTGSMPRSCGRGEGAGLRAGFRGGRSALRVRGFGFRALVWGFGLG